MQSRSGKGSLSRYVLALALAPSFAIPLALAKGGRIAWQQFHRHPRQGWTRCRARLARPWRILTRRGRYPPRISASESRLAQAVLRAMPPSSGKTPNTA